MQVCDGTDSCLPSFLPTVRTIDSVFRLVSLVLYVGMWWRRWTESPSRFQVWSTVDTKPVPERLSLLSSRSFKAVLVGGAVISDGKYAICSR